MSHADRSPTASPHDEPGENIPLRRASQSAQSTSEGWTTSSTTSGGARAAPPGRRARAVEAARGEQRLAPRLARSRRVAGQQLGARGVQRARAPAHRGLAGVASASGALASGAAPRRRAGRRGAVGEVPRHPAAASAGAAAVARLDLLELVQQRLGHPQRRGVDQPAVERHRAAALARRLGHRRDDPARLLRRGRVRA